MAPRGWSYNINHRTVSAPLAAFTMACVLFVYTRQSIHAAKINAQRHREADGGQISWRNESLRRHGVLARPDGNDASSMRGLFAREPAAGAAADDGEAPPLAQTEEERRVRERAGKK